MYQTQVPKNPAIELAKVFQRKTFEFQEEFAAAESEVISTTSSLSETTKSYAEIAAIVLMLVLTVVAFVTVIYAAMDIAKFFAELNQSQFIESFYGAEGADLFE